MNKRCIDCKAAHDRPISPRCAACSERRRRAQSAAWQRRARELGRQAYGPLLCCDCGQLTGRTAHAKRCKPCAAEAFRAQSRERAAARNAAQRAALVAAQAEVAALRAELAALRARLR